MTILADQLQPLYQSWQETVVGSGLDQCTQSDLLTIMCAQLDLLLSPTPKQLEFVTELHSSFDDRHCTNGHPYARETHDALLQSFQENAPYSLAPLSGTGEIYEVDFVGLLQAQTEEYAEYKSVVEI